jgi:competence CoiA-like predicted nuclease
MRFALVNDERREASPGLAGYCQGCSQEMVAKCGTQRVWHWAHRGNRNCEPWWEPETPWHRGWKDQFPSERQEIIRHDEKGEKHIADVMTENDLVIEFQHSPLPLQEKGAREGFYRNMVWVVDGTRLKGDHPRFVKGRRLFLFRVAGVMNNQDDATGILAFQLVKRCDEAAHILLAVFVAAAEIPGQRIDNDQPRRAACGRKRVN